MFRSLASVRLHAVLLGIMVCTRAWLRLPHIYCRVPTAWDLVLAVDACQEVLRTFGVRFDKLVRGDPTRVDALQFY